MPLMEAAGVTHLSRFFRVLTSRLRPSLASVASSSSRWSLRREALARVASSSASSSCRLSCFILAFAFSIFGKLHEPRQTGESKSSTAAILCASPALCPISQVRTHAYTCGHLHTHKAGAGLRPFHQPAVLSEVSTEWPMPKENFKNLKTLFSPMNFLQKNEFSISINMTYGIVRGNCYSCKIQKSQQCG